MNRFTYRACYQYNGPSHADPFRTERTKEKWPSRLRASRVI